jgi:hypothetical protein
LKTLFEENIEFRFIVLDGQTERMILEGALIGTLASCKLCRPSENWLGNYSPKQEIKRSGLWLTQHLDAEPISDEDRRIILNAIERTKEWLNKIV